MTNSLATFQTMMNNIFHDLIAEGIMVVYLDDILIFTRTEEEHAKAIRQVLCYETPKEERTSRAFRNLIDNIKLHNRVKL